MHPSVPNFTGSDGALALGYNDAPLRSDPGDRAVSWTAGLVHDLRNLLAVIVGTSETLLARLPPGDAARDLIGLITTAGERAGGLTARLAAPGREPGPEPLLLDVNEEITRSEALLRRLAGPGVTVGTVLAPGLGRVPMDANRLDRVLLNLVVNARDAMPCGGRLVIATRPVRVGPRDGADFLLRPGPHVRLTVSDTGVGMTAEVRARVFEPFFTTKGSGRGSGLGLDIVRRAVEQSSGWVGVDSAPGAGTTFTILLPAVRGANAATDAHRGANAATNAHRGAATVLVVDDAAAVRGVVRQVLESHGYSVLEAVSGRDAVRVAAAHDGPIHLLVTELVVPGAEGRALAARLTAARPELKALYLSGSAEVADAHVPVPGNVVRKPFAPEHLIDTIRRVLDDG